MHKNSLALLKPAPSFHYFELEPASMSMEPKRKWEERKEREKGEKRKSSKFRTIKSWHIYLSSFRYRSVFQNSLLKDNTQCYQEFKRG